MTSELTIEELQAYVDAIVGKDFDAPKLLPIRIAEQTIATMQLEANLRAQLLKSGLAMEGMREALQYAVDKYGKEGGPWNVPNDPGGWLDKARKALRNEISDAG